METFHHILKLSAGVGLFFFCYIFTGGIFKNLSEGVLNFYNALQRMRLAQGCDSNWYSSE
jgi:hypothetical protein